MCQANLIGHWLDGAPNAEERQRRNAALEVIVRVDEHGCRYWDGPAVLDLVRRWDRAFEWQPDRDPGLIETDGARLVAESRLVRALLTP